MTTIEERLKKIFREIFDDENLQLAMTTCQDDIPDWDSLAQVTLVEAVEEEFKVSMDMDKVFKLVTFGDFVHTIEETLK